MGAVFLILRTMSSEKLLRFLRNVFGHNRACSFLWGCRLQRQLLITAFLLMYACWMDRSTEYDDGGQDA